MQDRVYPRRRFLQIGLGGLGATVAALAGTAGRVSAATVAIPTPLPNGGIQSQLPFAHGFAVVRQMTGGTFPYGYIDRTGGVVIPCQYQDAHSFSEVGLAAVKLDYKWGFIDTHGAFVIKPQYLEVKDFAPLGLAAVKNERYQWGFIDTLGNEVIAPQFNGTGGFIELQIEDHSRVLPPPPPLAVVDDGYKHWYIDVTGKPVYPRDFGWAEPFSADGFAAVRPGGRPGDLWGFIDRSGTIVVPPQFSSRPEYVSEGISWTFPIWP